MTRIKTANLIGAQLDWAVAIARGFDADMMLTFVGFAPSRQWNDGGPIIQAERIDVGAYLMSSEWLACLYGENKETAYGPGRVIVQGNGPTPLIAAMRAFVASKLGDEVEVPEVQP